MTSHNFISNIVVPTRFTDESVTLIDHIFIRLPKSKINNEVTAGNLICDISDHLPNFSIINLNFNKNCNRPYIRLFNKTNISKFKANIENDLAELISSLNDPAQSSDINTHYNNLESKLHMILNKYFPLVRMSRKKFDDKDWITEGIKKAIKHRNNLFHIQLKCKTNENITKWKTYRNQLTKIIKDTQTRFYQNLIQEHSNSSIGLWKVFGDILSKNKNKNCKINQIKINTRVTNDPKEIAEAFNKFFCNIGPDLAKHFNNYNNNEHINYLGTSSNQSMYMTKTNTLEVSKLISNLDPKKSPGHDGFSSKYLKLCAPFISNILAIIFNKSITEGVFPDSLKIARVSPIHKKGEITDPSNYRPISVLSLINKVFEKIVHKRLYSYLTKFNLIYRYQYGFQEGYSTMHALVEATDMIKDAIDKKLLTCGLFIDLSKAFDTVDHKILLDKLFHYGIRGNVYNFFSSYLSNRKQFVRVNEVNSNLENITCGVPQG